MFLTYFCFLQVNNDLVTIPVSPKNENKTKSYGHRRSPSSHDFFKSHTVVEDQIINSNEKYQVIIDITNCKKEDLQIRAKENLLEVDGTRFQSGRRRWDQISIW